MSSDKIECLYCNIKILKRNYDRHYINKTHKKNELIPKEDFNRLQAWAKQNHINNYTHLSKKKIERIKKQFKTSNDNLELFDQEKLIDIAKKLSIRDFDILFRDNLIKQIKKSN